MASSTQWTCVWVNSGSWARRPGVLRFMGSQRVWHYWATELNWKCISSEFNYIFFLLYTKYWLCGDGDLVTQSCPTLCNPMDCSLPGSSVHGISQVRILEGVAIFFSRGSSQARDQTQISFIEGCLLHSRCILYWLSHQGSSLII